MTCRDCQNCNECNQKKQIKIEVELDGTPPHLCNYVEQICGKFKKSGD